MECVVRIEIIKNYHEVKNYIKDCMVRQRPFVLHHKICFFVRRRWLLFYTTHRVSMCQAALALATGSACQGVAYHVGLLHHTGHLSQGHHHAYTHLPSI